MTPDVMTNLTKEHPIVDERQMENIQSNRARLLKYGLTALLLFFTATLYAQQVNCANNCSDPACLPDTAPKQKELGCDCFDGIDNDGDGKIDKADPNCASYYGLTFVGEGSDCSLPIPAGNPFQGITFAGASSQNTADTQSKVSVGDVDGDGSPDAVITSKWNQQLSVVATWGTSKDPQPIDGKKAGEVKSAWVLNGQGENPFKGSGACTNERLMFEHENLIADIDKDGVAEIFGVVSNRNNSASIVPPKCFFLIGFKYVKNQLQVLPGWNGKATVIGANRPGTFGIADMDGDGKAELYVRDRIYAAETGALLATGNGDWDTDVWAGPVAADVIKGDNGRMELVVGTKIYTIPNLTNRNPATPATLTLAKDMNTLISDPAQKVYVKLSVDLVEYGEDTHSMVSIADIDRDGNIDVIISGALGSRSGHVAVFYWNVAGNKVSTYKIPHFQDDRTPDPLYPNGWPWGTGRVNIGDANGDGSPDFSFMSGNWLWCMTVDGTGEIEPLWFEGTDAVTGKKIPYPRRVEDSRSGVLTVTIYDFDSDGIPEMVYRDSQELVILDGPTGRTKLWSTTCQSHTYTEGPIIADVNGDGVTDICVPCFTSSGNFDINGKLQQQALGQVRLYYSTSDITWTPTRKVWNQPGYFVVNINDDMTLPFPQVDQNLVFTGGTCSQFISGPLMRLNVFLNQIPFLTSSGCPIMPAPDLAIRPIIIDGVVVRPAVEVIPNLCGDIGLQARFNVQNIGDLPISDNIPVSFYNGNPYDQANPGTLLHATTMTLANLGIDGYYQYPPEGQPPISFNGPGTEFEMYVVLNNDGTVIPIDSLAASPNECKIENNYWRITVTPVAFFTEARWVRDNEKCTTGDDTGEAKVAIYKDINRNGIKDDTDLLVTDYSNYTFQWYAGQASDWTPATPPLALPGVTSINSNVAGIPEGYYTIVVTNTLSNCIAMPADTLIKHVQITPDIGFEVVDQTKCYPPDGELKAYVKNGNESGVSYKWFDQNGNDLNQNQATLTGVVKGTNYVVWAWRGDFDPLKPECIAVKDSVVAGPDDPIVSVSKSDVVSCFTETDGQVSAQVLVNGVPVDPTPYKFEWFLYDNDTQTKGSVLPPGTETTPTRSVAAGWYVVIATDNTTQCQSEPQPIEVLDLRKAATVEITQLQKQTSCDPNNPNGVLQAKVFVESVEQDASQFTFDWFTGQQLPPAGAPLLSNNQVYSTAIGNQYYTARATHNTNGCPAANFILAEEDLNYPVITIITTPNGICDPDNATQGYTGSVTVAVTWPDANGVYQPVTDFTNYSFTWKDANGNVNPANLGTHPTVDSWHTLPIGVYSAIVTRTDLSCASNEEPGQVGNGIVLPALPALLADPSDNCDPALANGKVYVDSNDPNFNKKADGSSATLTYQWISDATGQSVSSGTPWESTANLQGGNVNPDHYFTLNILDPATGCTATGNIQLPDASELPLLALTPSPNDICYPTLTSPSKAYSGQVTSLITNPKGGLYTFSWVGSVSNTIPIPGSVPTDQQDLIGVAAGSYTLTVTHVPTGCVSDPDTRQVVDDTRIPLVDAVGSPDKICVGTPNGKAEITLIKPDASNPAGPDETALPKYRKEWYYGSGLVYNPATDQFTGSQLIPDATHPLLNLLGGVNTEYYTALVINQETGCFNTKTVEIAESKVFPQFVLTPTPNTNCENPNGIVTMTNLLFDGASLSTDAYTFAWQKENNGSPDAIATPTPPTAILNLIEATYSVEVTHIATGCPSGRFYREVNDEKWNPVIDVSVLANQTSCDPDGHNGSIRATVNEATMPGSVTTGGYTFTWVRSTEANGANPAPPGGSFALDGTGLIHTGTGLDGNFYYFIEVVKTETGCRNTDNEFLPEVITPPIVALAVTSPVTRCDTPNGSAAANVGGAVNGFTFYWLNEEGTNQTGSNLTVVQTANFTDVNNGNYTGLIPGYYTVVARENSTTCLSEPVTREVTASFDEYKIEITDFPNLPSSCNGTSGVVTLEVTGGSGAPVDIQLFDGGPVNTNPDINFFTNPPQFSAAFIKAKTGINLPALEDFDELGSQLYTAVVFDNSNGCGNFKTFFMPFTDAHDIDETLVHSNTCLPAGNGEVAANVTDIPVSPPGMTPQNFSYRLYSGSNPLPANLIGTVAAGSAGPGPHAKFDPLPGGFYTVEIKAEFGDGCPVYKVVEIDSWALPPQADVVGLDPNKSCLDALADGSANVQVAYRLHADDTKTTDLSFSISVQNQNVSAPTVPAGQPLLDGTYTVGSLEAGFQYQIRVTNTFNQCFTDRFVTINDQPAVAQILDFEMDPAEYCNPTLEESARVTITQMQVLGTGTDEDQGDYDFEWFTDETLATRIFGPTRGGATEGDILQNPAVVPHAGIVAKGSYWVKATKIDDNTNTRGKGCVISKRFDITDDLVDPVVGTTPFANTACDTNYEGRIEITTNTTGGPGDAGNTPTYTFEWTSTSATTPATTLNNPNAPNPASPIVVGQLSHGSYTVTATNNITGCSTIETANVIKLDVPVVIVDLIARDMDFCLAAANGEIAVDGVELDKVLNPTGTDFSPFEFLWFDVPPTPTTQPFHQGLGGNPKGTGDDVLSNLAPGTYWVKAKVDNAAVLGKGSGCISAPESAIIIDRHVDPTVSFEVDGNTTCDTQFDGAIQVNPVNPPGLKGEDYGSTFVFEWTTMASAIATNPAGPIDVNLTPYKVESATNGGVGLSDGQFVVKVTNDLTKCVVERQVTVPKDPLIITIDESDFLLRDQLICNADGLIRVRRIIIRDKDGNLVDDIPDADIPTYYDFEWFRSSPNSTALTDPLSNKIIVQQLDATNYDQMGAFPNAIESYHVRGFRKIGKGSGCDTQIVTKEIRNMSNSPLISMEGFANTACDDNLANGEIRVNITDNTDVSYGPFTFDYEWSNPLWDASNSGNTATVTDVLDGTHDVKVTNNQSGCFSTRSIVIERKEIYPSLALDFGNPTTCVAQNGDGFAEVIQVNVADKRTPDDFAIIDARFSYLWSNGETTYRIESILPGVYAAQVTDNQTGCISTPASVELTEDDWKTPLINITQTKLQLSCDDDALGTAELVALALEQDGVPNINGFELTWYNALDPDDPAALEITRIINNNGPYSDALNVNPNVLKQVGGEGIENYSVKVKSLDTECESDKFYIIQNETFRYRPNIALSQSSVLSCLVPDGSITVREITNYGDPANSPYYNTFPGGHQWFFEIVAADEANNEERDPDDNPDGTPYYTYPFTNPVWSIKDLDFDSLYTVRLVDMNTGCIVEGSKMVNDGRTYPVINIVSQNPLINCDPARPNGQLEATADGNTSSVGYEYEWFAGPDVNGTLLSSTIDPGTGSNVLIGAGSAVSPTLEFTVRVTNKLTGCPSEKTGKLEEGRLTLPKPDAFVIQDDTHCILDDGWVAAEVVEGEPSEHIFSWYNGGVPSAKPEYVSGTITPQPNRVDENYYDLPAGDYTVFAINVVTGCISEPRTIAVKEILVYPDLIFETNPSFCEDVKELAGTGRGTGTIALTLSPSEVVADEITWTDLATNDFAGTGNYVAELLPGWYEAEVTTSKGCISKDKAEVKTEIRNYNLVTVNNDGVNDSFIIDCISRFPNNNVKIFNRSGVLVYEADFYDNIERVFKGIGENGVYMTGTLLPVGTYFYIIDKGDGSKPRTGYLELVR